VNGDTAASLDSPVVLSTSATASSPAGPYPITASGAADANYSITLVGGTLTVTPAFKAFINFQPASSSVPAGYLMDSGQVYGNRGNGLTYGWNVKSTRFTDDRNSSLSPDQRYDTFNQMQKSGGSRVWEIAVPNGTYQVFLVAGDPASYSGVYRINVEGMLTVNGTPASGARWISGTKTVTVSDGRLTVSNATGSSNNKICFIEITSAPSVSLASVNPGVTPVAPRLSLLGIDERGAVSIRIDGQAGQTCVLEASQDMVNWTLLTSLENQTGTVDFIDIDAAKEVHRFYRAVVSRNPANQ